MLSRLGFESEIQEKTLLLSAVPAVLEEETIHDCIDSILHNLSFSDIDKGDIAHILISNIAKNAGKSKVVASNKESVDHLVSRYFNVRSTCIRQKEN